MNKKIHALEQNHTWEFTILPPGKIPIGCKWVYRIKLYANGTIERYKAGLVAKGFHQKKGVDFKETFAPFAPVTKMVIVRTLLVVAVHHDWFIEQLDINNAFSMVIYRKFV